VNEEFCFENVGIDGKIILEWILWRADPFIGNELTKHVSIEIDSWKQLVTEYVFWDTKNGSYRLSETRALLRN
jgi:hypothetical protein